MSNRFFAQLGAAEKRTGFHKVPKLTDDCTARFVRIKAKAPPLRVSLRAPPDPPVWASLNPGNVDQLPSQSVDLTNQRGPPGGQVD
jgi:hypothetical protein